jgi:hypothetical protein
MMYGHALQYSEHNISRHFIKRFLFASRDLIFFQPPSKFKQWEHTTQVFVLEIDKTTQRNAGKVRAITMEE